MRAQDVIHKPIITEKAMSGGEKNVYVFSVSSRANKHQIAQEVERLFNVEVSGVKTLVRKGKTRRVGKRRQTKTMPNMKKAYVTLKKGSINIVPTA
jgi:large subunit ribosomal protein L23